MRLLAVRHQATDLLERVFLVARAMFDLHIVQHVLHDSELRAGSGLIPSSVYCRAISATASPILFRTCGIASPCKHCRSFDMIAWRWASWRVRNSSRGSTLLGNFLVLVETRRNSTAANDRVCASLELARSTSPSHGKTIPKHLKELYRCVTRLLHLLHQTHQQDFRTGSCPFVVELFLGPSPHVVLGRRQAREELGEGIVHLEPHGRHREPMTT